MLTEAELTSTFTRMRPSIIRSIQQRVGIPYVAVDLADEAFFRAWASREKWNATQTGSSADSWIFRIAINLSVDYQRSAMKRREMPVRHFHEDVQPIHEPISDHEGRMYVRGLPSLDCMMAPCTPEQRQALDLHFRHGLTYAEIGERLGKGERACKSLVNRGIVKIRKAGKDDQGWLEKCRISG